MSTAEGPGTVAAADAGVGSGAEPAQRTTRLMWWTGAVSAGVLAGAAVQLLALSGRTAEFFAWTIAVPASAAFLGMFYLASAVMGVLALRQPLWAPARTALLPVVAFAGLVLVVTLVHLETFHLTAGGVLARAAAWVWLVVYLVTPPAYAFAWWRQAKAPGADPARGPGPRRWSWWTLAALGLPLAAAGVAMLVAPVAVAPWWPWPLTALTALTALTGRMIGATLRGVALLVGSVLWVDDRATGRIAATGLVVCAVTAIVVVLEPGAGAVRWADPSAWVYLGECVLLATVVAANRKR